MIDLAKEIEAASKRYSEVSYAKLSRIAKRFYELGKKDMKEQMMKEAVEGEARVGYPFSKPFIDIEQSSAQWCNMMKKFMNGDKVKLIVIKKEENK